MQYINDLSPTYTPVAGNGIIRAWGYVDLQELPPRIRSAMGGLELMAATDWSIAAWRQPILDEIEAQHSNNADTCHKISTDIKSFFGFLEARNIFKLTDTTGDIVVEWIESPGHDEKRGVLYQPATTTRRNRRWAARSALTAARLLGVPINPAALIRGSVIVDTGRKTRLLTDSQLDAVKTHANPGIMCSRRSVIVALSLAGAKPAEIAHVRLADVNLAEREVTLGKNRRRVNRLGCWECDTIGRRISQHPPSSVFEPLGVRAATDPKGAERSVRTQLSQLLRQAGIGHIDGVTGMSIRNTAARQIFEQHGIESAARFLGTASLDTAAAAVGHEWKSCDA